MSTQFFGELQKHSTAKLTILNNYVIPWMRKIVLNPWGSSNGCLIIDGFAGQGKYEDDGSDGSPLILLRNAIDFCRQAEERNWPPPKILLIFNEYSSDNYEVLKENIKEFCGLEFVEDEVGFTSVPSYPSVEVACLNETFEQALTSLLKQVGPSQTLIPSFCFIDPFGFSATPFEIIKRYLKNESAEILLNFIYEETNRFIKHSNPKIQEHMSKHFGVTDLQELKDLIGDNTGGERKKIIVDYYSRQLTENAGVNHVLNFEIKKNGRTKLILFHATKNKHGLKLMKKVMWGVDETGSYLFDDKKNPEQIEFLFAKEVDEISLTEQLAGQIYEHFKGKKNITEDIVHDFVLFNTDFPIEVFMNNSLKLLKKQGKIDNVRKRDGSKYRHGFSNV